MKQIQDTSIQIVGSNKITTIGEFLAKHNIEILNIKTQFNTSSQTEISDEEIEEESWRYREVTKDMEIPPNEDWSNGAKWYREQLKKKQ